MNIHVVRSGETLEAIARRFGVDADWLGACNAVPPDQTLAVGQTLVIRVPRQSVQVRSGDTLSALASRYGVSIRDLWRRNWPLGGGMQLRPGQTIVISYQDETPLGSAAFNGYAYPFITPSLLEVQLPYLTYLTPFTCGISAAGELIPLDDDTLRAAAVVRGTRPVMHLSTLTEQGDFNSARGELVLTDPEVQDRLIAEVVETAEEKDCAGVDVDFEYLPVHLGDEYAAFLAKLRGQLRARRRFLWAALAPKTRRNQPGLLYEAHNYAAIGMMTYEWGYTAGPPMAVAPLPNVRAVLDYAVTEIPPGQIYLGVPNYGYDWTLPFIQGESRARSISNQRAIQIAAEYGVAIQYDETAQSPFFHYTDRAGRVHEVWFEDARSLDAKLRLIAEYGFQGGGIWNLMRPFSQIWLLLDALYQIED